MTDAQDQAFTVDDLRRLFGAGSVRVLLDWDALRSRRASVQLRVLTCPVDLHLLRSTWYVDPVRRREVDHGVAERLPVLHQDVPSCIDLLDGGRAEKIRSIAADATSFKGPVLLPCYRLPDDELLVLDGNHRVAAAALRRAELRCLALVVQGPIDAAVLPDLRQWQQQGHEGRQGRTTIDRPGAGP